MSNKKTHTLLIILGILLFVMIIGKTIVNNLKIGEPIYFRYLVQHYLPTISESLAYVSTMELLYVQDYSDQRKIVEIRFVDHPEIKVMTISRTVERHGLYKVIDETLYMEWDLSIINEVSQVVDINYIQVTYSDGTNNKIDIGRICIYGGTSDMKVLEGVSCIPLYESEREQTYQVNESIRMEGLTELSKEFLGIEQIIQSYSLQVDGLDITNKPYEIIKGQNVIYKMSLNGMRVDNLKDVICDYDYIHIVPQLIYYDKSGKAYTNAIYSYPIWSSLENFTDVRQFIRKRKTSL